MNDLVFLDCETLGLHPDAPIWEFAAIRRTPDGTEYTTWITIQHHPGKWPDDLPYQFLDDYFRRYKADAAHSETRAAMMIDRATRGAVVIACNPGFDIERLTKLLQRNGITPSWHYHPIDSASVAIGFLAGRDELPDGPWKSDQLATLVGVDPAKYDRHTALGDVWWMMAQFDAMGVGR